MTSTDPAPDLGLRPADADDAAAVAEVFLQARRAAGAAMPPPVHGDADVLAHFSRLVAGDRVWVAERDGLVIGFLRLDEGWLDDLYVRPGHTGQGVGAALLDLAKALRPAGFALWVFETNQGARRFYRRHGLVELEHTDGSGNEEGAPDVRMAWPGRDPVAYLRGEVDQVDDELARLLARRAALTASIQGYKPVPGHAGREPEREAEIARRMAERAPGLGPEALRRIMHEVITVSLDAAEG